MLFDDRRYDPLAALDVPACACVCLRACVPACPPAHYCKKGGCCRVAPRKAQVRRRFGPPPHPQARVHGRLHATAWHAGWRHTGQRQARRNRKLLRDVRSTRRRRPTEPAINLVPNPTAWLAEPWLRVMSRKVFYSETDASGMS